MKTIVIVVTLLAISAMGYWYFTRDDVIPVYVVPVDTGLVEATVANTCALAPGMVTGTRSSPR